MPPERVLTIALLLALVLFAIWFLLKLAGQV